MNVLSNTACVSRLRIFSRTSVCPPRAVGVLMSESIAQIQWRDFTEAVPAFITILATPLTFSIATGLSLGLISYTVVKLAAGRFREINTLVWILTVLFILRYVYLAVA